MNAGFRALSDDELLAGLPPPGTPPTASAPDFAALSDDELLAGLPAPTIQQRLVASMPGRVLKGLKDPLDAGAQMLAHTMPSGIADGLNNAAQYVNELPVVGSVTKALGMTPASAQELDKMLIDDEQAYQDARREAGQSGFDGGRLIGNIAATTPLALAAPGAAATLPGRIAAGAVSGGLLGTMNPVLKGDFLKEKGKQAAMGAAGGGLLTAAGATLGRVLAPKAAQNPQIQKLLDEGITPTPGQIMGKTARAVEDKLASIPILGDAIRNARNRGVEALNRAALNRAVAPIGGKVRNIGRDGMREAGDMISQAYDDIIPRLTFRADKTFVQELGKLRRMARQMPSTNAEQFENIIQDQVFKRMTPQGGASGIGFRKIESEIGRLSQLYLHSSKAGERELGTVLAKLQNTLRTALQRANPQAAQELGKINRAYSLFTRLQRAAGLQGADDGIFSVTQLSSAVRASDRSMRHGKYARGEAAMQDLSDAARSVMRGTVPNSGTADRLLLSGGTALVSPQLAAGLGVAALPYLPGVMPIVGAALARRPNAMIQAGNVLERYAPAFGALFGQQAGARR